MPLDDNDKNTATAHADETRRISAIENELPAYRAICPGAVLSLVLGALSFLCYSSLYFLVVAIAAVVVGAISSRRIRRLSDILTGERLAQAGIALGLLFGLSSATISGVQLLTKQRAASKFARHFETVLAKGSIDDCIWYSQHPERRKGQTPKQLVAELLKPGSQSSEMMAMELAPLRDLKARLDEPNAEVRFVKIEGIGETGLQVDAYALYEVKMPERSTPGDKEGFALAIMHQAKHDGKVDWWVEKISFPYKPASFVAPEKPVDDGHGHGSGGHDH